jgi:putative transcriptional regulator
VAPAAPDAQAIGVHLDHLLADRGMTLTELSERVGVSVVNLSILKNGHARAIRFSTLTGLCQVLNCQPGDLLSYQSTGGQDGQDTQDGQGGQGGQPAREDGLTSSAL